MEQGYDTAALVRDLKSRVPEDAAALLARQAPERIAQALEMLPPDLAARIAAQLPGALQAETAEIRVPQQISELMEPVHGVLPATTTVAQACDYLRHEDTPTEVITYLYVADEGDRLLGLVLMRDLIVAVPGKTLREIMLGNPFHLLPQMKIGEAVKLAARRHYPVYPVCDERGHIIGIVRGWKLFERQAIEISAQSGSMVGVNKEERLATPVGPAFAQRHPWLQVNLLTAFLDVFVVGLFSGTIEKIVALAAFLPLLAGQSGNTGCQALAITLRGMTLGDAEGYPKKRIFMKELSLGLLNGVFTGLVAAGAMYWYASPSPDAFKLALTIWLAMVGGCIVAGLAGVAIPLLLKRFGADPVTASAIFLTTCTDIAGMGLMLVLATVIVLH
ncbi:MAG TPA: magnesium transporter [Nevskiaceae bacterium]|nr:magnesium transporter [Nevskiaceae bacterium]